MTGDESVEPFFARLAAAVGTPPLGDEEADVVLRLAKVVADWEQRRYAPVTAYAAGLAIGADAPDRIDRLRSLLAAVEEQAARG